MSCIHVQLFSEFTSYGVYVQTYNAGGAEIELAGSVYEEKLFDLKTKNIVLDVIAINQASGVGDNHQRFRGGVHDMNVHVAECTYFYSVR